MLGSGGGTGHSAEAMSPPDPAVWGTERVWGQQRVGWSLDGAPSPREGGSEPFLEEAPEDHQEFAKQRGV